MRANTRRNPCHYSLVSGEECQLTEGHAGNHDTSSRAGELLDALKRYGRHEANCEKLSFPKTGVCDCGLSVLLGEKK